jgi:O6-methylguanine-DNA--protein-cysteine methyltransferase
MLASIYRCLRFSDALDLRGKPFERRVWETLRAIPFGETASYGDIAKRIGAPKAAHANGGLWRQ